MVLLCTDLIAPQVLHSHLVLGERARLVAGNDGGNTQVLNDVCAAHHTGTAQVVTTTAKAPQAAPLPQPCTQ